MTIEVTTITGPAYWASALINGDVSGLDDYEIAALDVWTKRNLADGWYVVDVKRGDNGQPEESRFTWSYDLYSGTDTRGGDVIDYVIHRATERKASA